MKNRPKIKIGLRTIKTAISATLAVLVANVFHLEYAVSAGIIAVLSVSNTKKSTIITGVNRLLSLLIAILLAALLFHTLGFTPITFGIYLLLFIPITTYLGMSDGIVVNSVLVTHFLIEKQTSLPLILNELLLMCIGVGFALIANLYMPNDEKELAENQLELELEFKEIAGLLASHVNRKMEAEQLYKRCHKLLLFTEKNVTISQKYMENHVFSRNEFFYKYFTMRQMQVNILSEILQHMIKLEVDTEHFDEIARIFENLSLTYATNNDGKILLEQIQNAYASYREMPLPKTREEFENRAGLFQVLQLIEVMIQVKREFVREMEN
ncbi:Uncharacterized membrane protein YgaE, UPF0421/DUF939 family [Pilibacter termitis]|uniref:Uncharacterized membrane protein YgaE, UPF0421/DUF939 family n=1 Tax=Pilibacter termitis TaxID=263852 RepID=A0A1T4N540_9ENTE|nr:aromatic acid exporter family protein [Pilibacter termitis]SJZ74115.1 Uncharacterized membrane protein YgaE, UPF0421/DUF939 family [Pilibacter termitis]